MGIGTENGASDPTFHSRVVGYAAVEVEAQGVIPLVALPLSRVVRYALHADANDPLLVIVLSVEHRLDELCSLALVGTCIFEQPHRITEQQVRLSTNPPTTSRHREHARIGQLQRIALIEPRQQPNECASSFRVALIAFDDPVDDPLADLLARLQYVALVGRVQLAASDVILNTLAGI